MVIGNKTKPEMEKVNTHSENTLENKSRSVANAVSQKQDGRVSTFQFVDHRPETIVQRKLQKMADNSPRTMQLKAIQEMAANSLKAEQTTRLQAMAEHFSAQKHQPIQKRENKTGLPDNLMSGIENLPPAQLQAHAFRQGYNEAAPMQMKLLEPEQVLRALADIEFGGDLLKRKIKLSDERFKTPQGLSLLQYALAKMNLLKATWIDTGTGRDNHYNALLLSYTVDVVADYISRTNLVNLPRIKPVITQELIKHFANEISQSIKKQNSGGIEKEDIQEMLNIAYSLNGKDPITLYMKDILPLEKADAMIRSMARSAEIPVTEYFELLLNQFLDQILSLSPEQVAIGQAKDDVTVHNSGNDFPLQEVVGEISTDFYKYISGANKTYIPANNHLLKEAAVERTDALRESIYTPISNDERPQEQQDPTGNVVTFIQEITGVSRTKAEQIQQQLVQHLGTLAPQVTVKHDMWFNAEGLKTGVEYKSILGAQHKKENVSDIIKPGAKGQIDTLGRSGQGPMARLLKERGPRYMRWRLDKDSRAEGIDIPFNVYPIYGCLNYWDVDQWGAGGANYYGNVHFLLKNSVKERCFYKFTDAGIKRKTLLGLFNDLIVKHRATAAVILGDVIDAAIATKPTTRIEVVVPGGINILNDVSTIVVSSTVPIEVAQAIRQWAGQNSIAYVGETGEMDTRNSETLDPVTGLDDERVADLARPRYRLMSQTSLAGIIRGKLNDTAWNSKGSGFFGDKTPTGISKLRTIFNSNKTPARKLAEGKEEAIRRLSKEKSRDDSTTNFYEILKLIDIQSPANMEAFELSISRFSIERGVVL